ncbi:MAG: hypothetical protein HON81_05915, partial [Verrucomicrobia bacterium]|nr:hypothetical protein [Verrucomicrobiota bacterium]
TLSQIPYANYKIIVYLTGFNGNNASFVSDGNSTFYSLLSLTWSSDPGQTYAVKASTDLSNWGLELATSIDAREDSDTTTEEIDLSGVLELEDQKQIYFRVERL